jgi:hypothetical protein
MVHQTHDILLLCVEFSLNRLFLYKKKNQRLFRYHVLMCRVPGAGMS